MKPHLLLVEDNQHMQRIYKAKFQAEGFRVTTADNGERGLAEADACQPDVILLDIMLPKMDGFEVLKRLRADARLSGVPVFMLSNKSWGDDVEHALALGARQFFSKGSSTLQDIVSQIRTACGFRKVVVVSNNAINATGIVNALQHPKLLCSSTTLLAEAVFAIERAVADVVILDARDPATCASTTLQQLKWMHATQAARVIVIASEPHALPGADEYVAPEEMGNRLQTVVFKVSGAEPGTCAESELVAIA